MMKKQWFRMEVDGENPTVAKIFIFGFIGDWIDDLMEDIGWGFDSVKTAKSFQKEIDALPDEIETLDVRVNSPGGDVFGAVAIANILRDQRNSAGRRVEASVDGLAASAASIVIQAGDPIRIADNGLIMIHEPWTRAAGNSRELRKAADELDKISQSSIIGTYKWHSPLSEEEIAALMADTTWMNADEAVEWGFATEKVEGLKAAASLDANSIKNLKVPDEYRTALWSLVAKTEPKPNLVDDAISTPAPGKIVYEEPAKATDVLRLCREASCLDIAESLINEGLSLERVRDRVNAEKEVRAAAETRAAEIRALCQKAQLPEFADGYIKGAMELEDIRAHLTTVTAKLDRAEIDAGLDPDHGLKPKAKINVSEIYATRNRLQLVSGKKE